MDKDKMTPQPLTEGRKKGGEEFSRPVDDIRITVRQNAPVAEYRAKPPTLATKTNKRRC